MLRYILPCGNDLDEKFADARSDMFMHSVLDNAEDLHLPCMVRAHME